MTRVLVIGAGAEDTAAQLEALGLSTIRTAVNFREVAELLPVEMHLPAILQHPAPAFGGDRPYLKKKKGRS